MFDAYLEPIAAAYAAAPELQSSATETVAGTKAWQALADDSLERAAGIRLLLEVSETDDPEPYPDAVAMCEDIAHDHRFIVSTANSEHPSWTVAQNVDFRIVHDVLGHYAAGTAMGFDQWSCFEQKVCTDVAGFDWRGENLACAAHVRLLGDPLARMALFTECIAQTGYAIARGGFGPQKMADLGTLLPHTVRDGLRCAYRNWLEGGV